MGKCAGDLMEEALSVPYERETGEYVNGQRDAYS